jgi:hypothetical protein
MASDGGERRMLFDIRGRRRNVVKVVYAILALLMGLSLILLAGPGIGSIFNSDSGGSASGQFEDQAEKIERKLVKSPEDPELLLSLTRARINAGNAGAEINPETGAAAFPPEARQQLALASESWSKYLKASDEPSAGGAQLAAQMLFGLAQSSRTGPEAEANVRAAAKAQAIVADQRPSLGSLSTLAIYRLYSFDYEGAEAARKEAESFANTKFEKENLGNEFDATEKSAKEFEKQLQEIEKEAKKAREEGKPSVANPLGESNPLGGG